MPTTKYKADLAGRMPIKGTKCIDLRSGREGMVHDVFEKESETIVIEVWFAPSDHRIYYYWEDLVFEDP